MRYFLFIISMLFISNCSTVNENFIDLPLSSYIHNEYEGYSGKSFFNDKDFYVGADINWIDKEKNSIYLLERSLEESSHCIYICKKQNKTTLGGYLFKCKYNDKALYLRLETKLENKEKIVYVSISDNQDCITKYKHTNNLEKYCNPKTNKSISYLKLYNLYF